MLFTYNPAIDIIIMSYVDDDDLEKLAQVNKYAYSLYNSDDFWVHKLIQCGFPYHNNIRKDARKIYNMTTNELMRYALNNKYKDFIGTLLCICPNKIWDIKSVIDDHDKQTLDFMVNNGLDLELYKPYIGTLDSWFLKYCLDKSIIFSNDEVARVLDKPEYMDIFLSHGYEIQNKHHMILRSMFYPGIFEILLKHKFIVTDSDLGDIIIYNNVKCLQMLIDHKIYTKKQIADKAKTVNGFLTKEMKQFLKGSS